MQTHGSNTRRIGVTLGAGALALALAYAPMQFELGGHQFGVHSAQAKGNEASGGDHGRPEKSEQRERHDNHGAEASTLGSLNAAHASANARLHASADSTVGKIAIYESAWFEAVQLRGEITLLEGEVGRLESEAGDLDLKQLDADLEAAKLALAEASSAEATIVDQGAGTAPDVVEVDLEALATAVEDAQQTYDDAVAAREAVEVAKAELAAAESDLAAVQLTGDDALIDAANREIVDEQGGILAAIRIAVNGLLGLASDGDDAIENDMLAVN